MRLAVTIVTYNRPGLLDELLESVLAMNRPPFRVVVVDNASAPETAQIIESYRARLGDDVLVNHRMETNTGGAGGFSEGVRLAVEAGADWIWLMDDDVEILPEAMDRFEPWMDRFAVLHGRRYDVDGTPFFWQAKFNQFLGVPLPYTRRAFSDEGYAITNSGTFEGMLIRTDIVRSIGLPDPRFFISWDDAIYAWLASRQTEVAYVDAFVLKRKRAQRQVNLGLRHLNDSSALAKYHVMRNRAYVGRYFAEHGKLNRPGFALGTVLTLAKEIFRLVVVERSLRGLGVLMRGVRDGRRIWRDREWAPMPPLTTDSARSPEKDHP
ncbi:glycosyltransferase [Bogoriella caseilytica]|uniref:GT2 family glycosyltransferase n=1 Tax=Bogoriella caseilytica TaxID=56055 RepID=A0A3N2BA16_9MICO|nr:glycosyltransferase [Bogoriella caseilytica]ROR72123.1 GT2 family glycosyltransferase [Bogoriella caseilytica]